MTDIRPVYSVSCLRWTHSKTEFNKCKPAGGGGADSRWEILNIVRFVPKKHCLVECEAKRVLGAPETTAGSEVCTRLLVWMLLHVAAQHVVFTWSTNERFWLSLVISSYGGDGTSFRWLTLSINSYEKLQTSNFTFGDVDKSLWADIKLISSSYKSAVGSAASILRIELADLISSCWSCFGLPTVPA